MANYYPYNDFIAQMRSQATNPLIGEALARKAKWLRFIWTIAQGFRLRPGGTETVNWAAGGSANYATTSTWASNAALDVVGSGAAGSTSGSHDYKMALIDGKASADEYAKIAGQGDPMIQSAKLAAGHVERKVAVELIDGAGTGIQVAGLEYFFSTLLTTGGMTVDASGVSGSGMQQKMDEAVQLQENDTNLIICGKPYYRELKKQMRSAGGITPIHEGLRNFGLGEVLNWDGIPVVYHSSVADNTAYACYFDHEDGIDVVAPIGKADAIWTVAGSSETGNYDWLKLFFAFQMQYQTPRCVAQITGINL